MPMLKSGTVADVGWLHPIGTFYPSKQNVSEEDATTLPSVYLNACHEPCARMIVQELYHTNPDDLPDTGELSPPQQYLIDMGWVRIDTVYNLYGREGISDLQARTLRDMIAMATSEDDFAVRDAKQMLIDYQKGWL